MLKLTSTRFLFIVLCFFVICGCAIPMKVPLKEHTTHFSSDGITNKGIVYFYRDTDWQGSARGIYILHDGEKIGALNNGTYFAYLASPGKNIFEAENLLGDNLKRVIDIEAGKKYYIRGEVKSGIWDALPRITIVNEAEGFNAVQALKHATLK